MYKFVLMLTMAIFAIGGMSFVVGARELDPDTIIEPEPTPPSKTLLKHEHTADCEKTSAEPVQIICILDRSGSMSNLTSDTIGGYNSFIEKQKQETGKAEVTTVLFNNRYQKITDAVDLQEVPTLTNKEYYASGTTALLDAVGSTIADTLGKMESQGICPAKRRVLIMIMTDGLENASQEYRKAEVKSMIEQTTKDYNWNYIFMGANIDSAAEATAIGIDANFAADYSADGAGIERSFEQMDTAAKEVRKRGKVNKDWNEEK